MSQSLSVAPVRPSAGGPWRAFLRAPISKRTWLGFAFLVVKAPLGVVGFGYTIMLLAFGVGIAITFLGLPLIGLTVLGGRQFGRLHRGIGRAIVGARVADPVRFRAGPGLLGWLRSALRDATGWRALAYLLVSFAVSPVAAFGVALLWAEALVAVFYPAWWAIFDPTNKDAHGVAHHAGLQFGSFFFDTWPKAFLVTAMGLVATFLAPWPIRAVAALDGVLMRWLLGPTKASLRVHELEETRAQAVDESAAALRRIERDLHDGTQARLVALAMSLGRARETLDENGDPARARRARRECARQRQGRDRRASRPGARHPSPGA